MPGITIPILLQHLGLNWTEIKATQNYVYDLISESPPLNFAPQIFTRAIQAKYNLPTTGVMDNRTAAFLTKLTGGVTWSQATWFELFLFLDKQPMGGAHDYRRF